MARRSIPVNGPARSRESYYLDMGPAVRSYWAAHSVACCGRKCEHVAGAVPWM